MTIGFDLDGIICDINIFELVLSEKLSFVESYYYKERKPLLNPYMFLTNDDDFIIITAREKRLSSITKQWIDKFLPGAKWFIVDTGYNEDPRETAEKKLKILLREKVEVYFDDNPDIIKELRKKCNTIKFIQFGGRL